MKLEDFQVYEDFTMKNPCYKSWEWYWVPNKFVLLKLLEYQELSKWYVAKN